MPATEGQPDALFVIIDFTTVQGNNNSHDAQVPGMHHCCKIFWGETYRLGYRLVFPWVQGYMPMEHKFLCLYKMPPKSCCRFQVVFWVSTGEWEVGKLHAMGGCTPVNANLDPSHRLLKGLVEYVEIVFYVFCNA
ncbi:UNVERIFIED_CONTAM: hypothetical protein K2H54_066521 [Gekko kuhli]